MTAQNSEARKRHDVIPTDTERLADIQRTVDQIERLCLRIIRGPIAERDDD